MSQTSRARWAGVGLAASLALLGCRVEAPSERAATEQTGSVATPAGPSAIEAEAVEPEPAAPERSLGVADRGVFGDLDAEVQLTLPASIEPERLLALVDRERALLLVYADHRPIKVYPLLAPEHGGGRAKGARALALDGETLWLRPGDHAELDSRLLPGSLRALAPGTTAPPGDRDGDGIPDPLDLTLGAIKTTLNGATYNQDYVTLDYPGGDVPRELGACTDVIVRALRNAGLDLQRAVHDDIGAAPRRYRMVERANADIDHRRVRTLLPWFRGHWRELAGDEQLAPGDVIFMDTIASRAGPDHIGIVGPDRGPSGAYLIANNWTDGSTTAFMDLLAFVEVSDRFRMPPAPEHAGPIPATATQLLVVRGAGWDEFRGQARRFERDAVAGDWRPVGPAFPIVLGHAGLAWGRGLHGEGRPDGLRAGAVKREGDGRSPAGVFTIGPRYVDPAVSLRCVDDPSSRHYAAVIDEAAVTRDWASAEDMAALYELAIVVDHNRERVPGEGSCIFVHGWDGPDQPVTGCTATAAEDLATLAAWLRPGAVIVSVPEPSYAALAPRWSLPSFDAGLSD